MSFPPVLRIATDGNALRADDRGEDVCCLLAERHDDLRAGSPELRGEGFVAARRLRDLMRALGAVS